jgi:hypothetical protein
MAGSVIHPRSLAQTFGAERRAEGRERQPYREAATMSAPRRGRERRTDYLDDDGNMYMLDDHEEGGPTTRLFVNLKKGNAPLWHTHPPGATVLLHPSYGDELGVQQRITIHGYYGLLDPDRQRFATLDIGGLDAHLADAIRRRAAEPAPSKKKKTKKKRTTDEEREDTL